MEVFMTMRMLEWWGGGGGGRRARGKEIGAPPPLTLSTTNKLFLCQRNSDEALM